MLAEVSCRARDGARAARRSGSSFAPEAHAACAVLGLDPSPGPERGAWTAAHRGAVAMTDDPAYCAGRGSLLGDVPGEVVAAAFGVFSPAAAVSAVSRGRRLSGGADCGDAHVAAFAAAGLDGARIRVLTERVAGMPPRTDSRTRGWGDGHGRRRDRAAYHPSSPQEAVMVDDVRRRMTTAGLGRSDGVPAR